MKYLVIRFWNVEAKDAIEAIDKSRNWNHFKTMVDNSNKNEIHNI